MGSFKENASKAQKIVASVFAVERLLSGSSVDHEELARLEYLTRQNTKAEQKQENYTNEKK